MTSKKQPRGYVLLVVIAVCVMIITVLSTLAKVSLRRSLEAADAQRSLQMRWGALSLERAITGDLPVVFELQESLVRETSPGTPPPASIRTALTLGGVTFDLLLGDEDAKLNLNAFYHQAGAAGTEQALARVTGSMVPGTVRLLPAGPPMNLARESRKLARNSEEEVDDPPPLDVFRSWGEVFDLSRLRSPAGHDAVLPAVTTGITCWGSGQLNLRRASDEAILAVAGSVVQDGGARRLLQSYRKSPSMTLQVMLQTEISNPEHRRQVATRLSETSTNFSLWIDASAGRGQRLRTFTATRRDEEGFTKQSKFAF